MTIFTTRAVALKSHLQMMILGAQLSSEMLQTYFFVLTRPQELLGQVVQVAALKNLQRRKTIWVALQVSSRSHQKMRLAMIQVMGYFFGPLEQVLFALKSHLGQMVFTVKLEAIENS